MAHTCKAKICGNTNIADARTAADAGADFFGVVVEVDFSPRSLTIQQAAHLFSQPPLPAVALVFEITPTRLNHLINTLNPHAVQFLGDSDPAQLKTFKSSHPTTEIWQSVHLPQSGSKISADTYRRSIDSYLAAGVDTVLLDTATAARGQTRFGGTGQVFDWEIAKQLMESMPAGFPVWLAGGINPENVRLAIETVAPYGIDLCSGVEAVPGKKDPKKIHALMDAIRAASNTRRTHH